MTNNLIDLTGFATLLTDIVDGAETKEERDHLLTVVKRLKAGEPTVTQSDPWMAATVG